MTVPIDIVKDYPVRKTKKQKEAFGRAVTSWLQAMGYSVHEERGNFGCCNIVIGNPTEASYLVTAHYDTCVRRLLPKLITPCSAVFSVLYQLLRWVLIIAPGAAVGITIGTLLHSSDTGCWIFMVLLSCMDILLLRLGPANPSNENDNTSGVLTLLEMASSIPVLQRDNVCFVLLDLEETGGIGSAAYRENHREETEHQIVLSLDCVGDGDFLYLFPTEKLRKEEEKLSVLRKIAGSYGKKQIVIWENGFSVYPSARRNFPYGVGICALRKGKVGPYLSRIHTSRDTVLEETNVNLLRAALITLISGAAAQ